MSSVEAIKTVSVTELERNLSAIIDSAGNEAVAITYRDKLEAYLLSVEHYEKLLERVEDLEDIKLAHERANGPFVDVQIDDL